MGAATGKNVTAVRAGFVHFPGLPENPVPPRLRKPVGCNLRHHDLSRKPSGKARWRTAVTSGSGVSHGIVPGGGRFLPWIYRRANPRLPLSVPAPLRRGSGMSVPAGRDIPYSGMECSDVVPSRPVLDIAVIEHIDILCQFPEPYVGHIPKVFTSDNPMDLASWRLGCVARMKPSYIRHPDTVGADTRPGCQSAGPISCPRPARSFRVA